MDEKLRVTKIRENFIQMLEKTTRKLEKLKEELLQAQEDEDDYQIEECQTKINELLRKISMYQSHIEYMRPNNEEDINQRGRIMKEFPSLVSEFIPDGVPMVFHGNNEIGIIHEIIQSGGLKTPEERGVGFTSFATQVDVTNKYDIHVSCEFADPGINTFMPYGAIFCFYPLPEERETVLKNSGSEVPEGVKGIDFKEERFVGAITTLENKGRIMQWFIENGIDASKVFTHSEFLEMCRKKFAESEVTLQEEKKIY